MNDNGLFDRVFKDIYPDVLELNATNSNNSSSNYLDMSITMCNDKFEYELYDKRNDYDFQVISMPNLKSNIPVTAAYSVIYSQVLRYFKATSNIDKLYVSLGKLKSKMIGQNFKSQGIIKQFNKFFVCRRYDIIAKFWQIPSIHKI